jgi:hypothetical protein
MKNLLIQFAFTATGTALGKGIAHATKDPNNAFAYEIVGSLLGQIVYHRFWKPTNTDTKLLG